eukprot:485018-Prorocentrum_minimum.AAC.1
MLYNCCLLRHTSKSVSWLPVSCSRLRTLLQLSGEPLQPYRDASKHRTSTVTVTAPRSLRLFTGWL